LKWRVGIQFLLLRKGVKFYPHIMKNCLYSIKVAEFLDVSKESFPRMDLWEFNNEEIRSADFEILYVSFMGLFYSFI